MGNVLNSCNQRVEFSKINLQNPNQSCAIVCSAGKYNNNNICVNCLAGTFQNSSGQTSCVSCSKGTYQDSTGQISCKSCGTNGITLNTGSTSINDLIRNVSQDGPVRWLHLDVEGLDDKLILSIEESLLPEILVYENENIGDESNNEVRNYLVSKNYKVTNSGRNVIAYRNLYV